MGIKEIKSCLLLLLAAFVWGFSFVMQKLGTKHIGAFTFTGIRFVLGSLSLIPLIIYSNKKMGKRKNEEGLINNIIAGSLVGSALFVSASLQQIGLAYTEAGKAGFITCLYIVIVPILGLFLRQHVNILTWMGMLLSVFGLYFLSIKEGFNISKGDLFVTAGAFFCAVQIILIDFYVKRFDPILLSFFQFAICSIFSMIAAFVFEKINFQKLSIVIIPLLYGGIISVGIAHTLQIIGQKHAKPSHAAIIMSMESVFASISGYLILGEVLDVRGYIGSILMLAGMLLSHYDFLNNKPGTNLGKTESQ